SFIPRFGSIAGPMTITGPDWFSSRATCLNASFGSCSMHFSASLRLIDLTVRPSRTTHWFRSEVTNSRILVSLALHAETVRLMLRRNGAPTSGKNAPGGGKFRGRLWRRQSLRGFPADIDPSRYSSLVAMFEEGFTNFAAREACVCMGKSLTYAELNE